MMKHRFYRLLQFLFNNYNIYSDISSIGDIKIKGKSVSFNGDDKYPEELGPDGTDTGICIAPIDRDDCASDDVYEDLDSIDAEPQFIPLKDIISVELYNDNTLTVAYDDGEYREYETFYIKDKALFE